MPQDGYQTRETTKMKNFEPASDAGEQGSIFFSGTATTVIRIAGFTLLTDPNFIHRGDHLHLGYGLKTQRLTEPALSVDEANALPLDAVILSHLHADHFDPIAEEKLNKAFPIVTTPHAARNLAQKGFNTTALRTWQTERFEKNDVRLEITALPGEHGPSVVKYLLPPVMGSLLEFTLPGGQILRLYISGDTLVFEGLHEIPKKYPAIDLGLLHLGGARILGILVTMDADQGLQAIKIVNPQHVIPVHYGDYDVFKQPIEVFQDAVKAAGLEDRVTYLNRGETYRFPLEPTPQPAAAAHDTTIDQPDVSV
jgi:L-ascorbate metabolism protein UlaG (beta-lactamase superfamily)